MASPGNGDHTDGHGNEAMGQRTSLWGKGQQDVDRLSIVAGGEMEFNLFSVPMYGSPYPDLSMLDVPINGIPPGHNQNWNLPWHDTVEMRNGELKEFAPNPESGLRQFVRTLSFEELTGPFIVLYEFLKRYGEDPYQQPGADSSSARTCQNQSTSDPNVATSSAGGTSVPAPIPPCSEAPSEGMERAEAASGKD